MNMIPDQQCVGGHPGCGTAALCGAVRQYGADLSCGIADLCEVRGLQVAAGG